MLTYDLRSLVRRYTWTLPLALVAFCFYTGLLDGAFTPRISISMDLPLLGPTRTLYSVGEWGRSILLSLELYLSIPLSALIGLLVAQPLSDEMAHGDVLECTPRATHIPLNMMITATSLAWLCVVVGGATAFLNPLIRAQCSLSGWSWLPLLLTLAWLRIAVWTTTCALMFYLTGSKWMAIASVPLVQIAWFASAVLSGTSLLAFVHRGLLAWGFLGPFLPVGISPGQLVIQVIVLLGTLTLLLGAGMWAKSRRIASSTGYRWGTYAWTTLGAAIVIISLVAYTSNVQRTIAALVSADSETEAASPPATALWSREGRLIRMPGTYSALRLASACETPAWYVTGEEETSTRRFDTFGQILSLTSEQQWRGKTHVEESLVLSFPTASPIPNELTHRMEAYRQRIDPMLKFVSSWRPVPLSVILIYPSDMLSFRPLVRIQTNEIWIDEATLIDLDRVTDWETAWAVATILELDDEATAYTTLYLESLIDRDLALTGIQALEMIEEGVRGARRPYLPQGMSVIVHAEGVAERLLAQWHEGEVSGHVERITQLMKGRQDD